MSNILTALLELITGGLTTMATNIGAGLKAFIEGIFIVVPTSGDPTLSTFGSLIAIFAGISLAFALCRWVLNFCTSLGARNR